MDSKHQNERFDTWVAEHIAILYRTANGFAAGEDRKDLLQDMLLALWKAVPSYREEAKVSTFIYTVAHNTALTWKRSQRNYHRKMDRYETSLPRETHSPSPGPDRELLELMYAEIRKLPSIDRSLALLFLDDVSYREMSAIHGLSESNVGVRLNRLKQKLAAAMKEVSHGI